MDTFFDSSWYFLRYLDPNNAQAPFDPEVVRQYLPVDIYVGGEEHACMHLLYARFITHFLNSIGLLDVKEPFRRLVPQGLIRGQTFVNPATGKFLPPDSVLQTEDGTYCSKETGDEIVTAWKKMSKSKYNGVLPAETVGVYGADVTRVMLLNCAAPLKHMNWNSDDHKPVLKWFDMTLRFITTFTKERSSPSVSDYSDKNKAKWEPIVREETDSAIRTATWCLSVDFITPCVIQRLQLLAKNFNRYPPSVIAHSEEYSRAVLSYIVMLHPFAPHFSAELWSLIQPLRDALKTDSFDLRADVWEQAWPKPSPTAKLLLFIYIDDDYVGVHKVTGDELRDLTQAKAEKLALKNKGLRRAVEENDIKLDPATVDFKKMPDLGASLNFVTC